jgi:thioredoxin-like negative regulator of GroEL
MSKAAEAFAVEVSTRPRLIFFYSEVSGRCRRVEGFLSQVLQRRRNHETFLLQPVAQEQCPDLLERFRIDSVPTICILEGEAVTGRLVAPRGCREIEEFLAPWLR